MTLPHVSDPLDTGLPAHAPDGVREALLCGAAVVLALVFGLGIWAGTASLSGAVLAGATVVVDGNVKKVQHPAGGTIGEIRVKDGDRVASGDLLLRLDETVARANLQIVANGLDELSIRQARLKAERDSAAALDVPQALAARSGEAEVAAIIAGERGLFESRSAARSGQKAQLRERIAQLKQEIEGLTAQQAAKDNEITLVRRELAGAETLWKQNLMPISKLTALQREAARIEGERGQLLAQAAQARGKISEIELQIIQIDQDLRTEVLKELREAQAKQAELVERRVAAEDQLKHIDIRAPISGVVHQMEVHTVGGVIAQGEALMLIVPEGDALVLEAKIAPQDIDHVRQGQAAYIRFTAFDQRRTPEFDGVVTRVAADLSKDAQSGAVFYVARLALSDVAGGAPTASAQDEAGKTGLKLVSGMPAEVHIRTGERTAMSYFLKPLRDQFARAFTER